MHSRDNLADLSGRRRGDRFHGAMELGFRYATEEIIVRAAEKAGVSPETVAAVGHTPGLVGEHPGGMPGGQAAIATADGQGRRQARRPE